MAKVTSGSFTTNSVTGYGATAYLTLSWTATQSIPYNNSKIAWNLKFNISPSGYYRTLYNGYVVVDGQRSSFSTSRKAENGNIILSGETTVDHGTDGNKTLDISCGIAIGQNSVNASGSGSWELTTIPRYTNISSFTVSKRNETSFVFNWSTEDIVDYVWYSTNNGTNWTGYDVTDGTSGSFNVTGLSPNTTYNCKLRVRRADSQLTTDSSTVSQTTYKAPSQSLSSKTETSITMNWSCDTTANHIWYSTDNGSTWVDVGNVNATSGSYTISGLTANTLYNIKTRVRRNSTNTTYDTSTSNQTTYNYPYVSSVGTSNLTIGNSQTLTLYNPLGRSCTVYMKQNSTSGTQLYSGTTSGTSITFTPTANTLYASIPNTQSGNAVYYCTYSNHTVSTKSGTYKIIGTEIPMFEDFSYLDSNSIVTAVTGNNQVMVKGLSTAQVTISSANKMIANSSATPSNYAMNIGNLTDTVNYSANNIIKELGTIASSGTQRLSVTAYDSRGLYKTVYKDITVYDYIKPIINATITRLNNFEAETTINVSGTYTKLSIDNDNKNSITSVKYRYRESGGTWTNWVNLNTTVNNGSFTCSGVVLSLDNTKAFEFEIQATDTLQQTTTTQINVGIGQAIFFISTNNRTCYINGKEVVTNDYTGNVNITGTIKENNKNIVTDTYTGNVGITGTVTVNNKEVVTNNYTGDVDITGNVKVNNSKVVTSSHTGNVDITGDLTATNIKGTSKITSTGSVFTGGKTSDTDGVEGVVVKSNGDIELVGTSPCVDFYYNKSTSNYTSRIVEDASGRLSIVNNNGLRCEKGFYSYDTGNVGTAKGTGKLLIKRASSSEAPNNGVVLEYGNSTSYTGQLFFGDNSTQGVYYNGWSNGTRGSWRRLADIPVTLYNNSTGIQSKSYASVTGLSNYKKLAITFTAYKNSDNANTGGTASICWLDLTKKDGNGYARGGIVIPYSSAHLSSGNAQSKDFKALFEADVNNNRVYCLFSYDNTVQTSSNYVMTKIDAYYN